MRSLLAFVFVAALAAFFVSSANGGKQGGATFNREFTWLQTCNDWQSTPDNCVTDTPTANGGQPCVWGDQDELYDAAYGKLSAGQSVSDTLCIVTDGCNDGACPHQVVWNTSGAVSAILTSDRGGSWSGTQGCFADPLWPQTSFPPLDGTGGVGYLTKYTLTVTALKTTQMYAGLDLTSSHSEGEYGYYRQLAGVPCPN